MLKPTSRFNRSGTQDERELAVRALFDAEESRLLRFAFSLIGRRAVAEEIVQDVFLQLHIHWHEIETPQAWLFRSVRNRAYNHIRNHRREVLTVDDGNSPASRVQDEVPEVTLLRIEATAALRRMLEELDQTDRQLVTLKYFEGLQYRDISAQTGLSTRSKAAFYPGEAGERGAVGRRKADGPQSNPL